MGYITFIKGWVKAALEAQGVTTVWTRAEANEKYEVPKTAVIPISEDKSELTPEKTERFVGTKDQQGHYNHDGRLHTYRSRRVRRTGSWKRLDYWTFRRLADGVIEAILRDAPEEDFTDWGRA